MFLGDPGPRSVFQGDIYDDVPLTKLGAGDTPAGDPKPTFPRITVATALYPCDIVGPDNVSLIKSQPAVRVYDAAQKGLTVSPDWEGPIAVCPLPDLRGDGRMWVADFRTIFNVERSYLLVANRVRCLSELGWGIFRQRLAGAGSRALANLDDILEVGRATWAESEMEALWVAAGRDLGGFHTWLDTPDSELPLFESRRRALEAHEMIPFVRDLLDQALTKLDLDA